ncbi:hypothetical protein C1893_19580 [Pseudomonas sp. MPR-ANC1]|uniref:hypothetical protein n=1 Tax=Pseudomonas sp. MPR-ANC1 TaxID=2075548 RepID=UPI000CD3175E|nr:hypothetical protein [Pseudomonas sp. MPR-ANC1]POA46547.1 hypothetical protein C1893_19580 [Pseudomonas sp. MPR-ANC1]
MNKIDFKKYNMNGIIRSNNSSIARKHQLTFFLKVLHALNIKFANCKHDPMHLAQEYIDGKITTKILKAESSIWWAKIDEHEAIRNFRERKNLMARLALCLLMSEREDVSELGDDLSWFLEVLGFLGAGMKPTELMIEYFDFR